MNESVLIVDDEAAIADLVDVYLKNEGYQVYKFYSGREALSCIETTSISLAILDIMLPDIDGFALCQEIRKNHFFPIIMLTARVEDMDKITGLTLGADDYVTKPFHPLELMARVKTQLRRYTRYNQYGPNSTIEEDELDIRGLSVNKSSHICTLNNRELALTPMEFDILWYLCKNQGRVVSSEELFEAVWKEKYLDNNNTVMAHIARLREKMGEPARRPKFIKTVWGVGYTIEKL
ncbi:MAG: VanR-ABDEGLN family response regulator transcription factor [Roseburia sp.]|nr:VanR-ABDEGLN family response regulator transcription factor [Roseburia sp.]